MQHTKIHGVIARKAEYLSGDTLTKKIGAGGVVLALVYAIFVDFWGGVCGVLAGLVLRHSNKVDDLGGCVHDAACTVHNALRSALGVQRPSADEHADLMAEAEAGAEAGARAKAGKQQPEVSAEVAGAQTKVDIVATGNLLKAMLSPELRADLDVMEHLDYGQKEDVLNRIRSELGI